MKQDAALWRGRGLSLVAVVLILYGVAGATVLPSFLGAANLTAVLFSTAVALPAVLGMQALIILGKFDLSVGASGALSAMCAAIVMSSMDSLIAALFCGLLIGAAVGAINGLLVTRLSIDSLIATLAMMGICRSLALISHDGRIVSGLPDYMLGIGQAVAFGMPLLVLLAAALLVISALVFSYVVPFRRFYAVGGNPRSATLAGVSVYFTVIAGFILAGIGAAATGLIQIARTQSASPLLFQELALDSIAACVIGGSSLRGGRGTMHGAALGLLVVAATRNIVVISEVTVYWKDLAVGFLVLAAVSLDTIGKRLKAVPQQSGKSAKGDSDES